MRYRASRNLDLFTESLHQNAHSMIIRSEQSGDASSIREILLDAFATGVEAGLVDALRDSACENSSLVAVNTTGLVGHVFFSPVILENWLELKLMGLAPLAVSASCQGQGTGSRLVEAGIVECQGRDVDALVVLGEPDYYRRFGFQTAADFGIRSVYDVEDRYFMLLELKKGALRNKCGVVNYHPCFANL
jgi:putative acetyltransferase